MRELTSEEFELWERGEGDLKNSFVIVKTQSCVKCRALTESFSKYYKYFPEDEFASYTFMPGKTAAEAGKILEKHGVASVPVILFRYTKDSRTLTHTFRWTEEYDLDNWLSAISEGLYAYFGRDEFGELVESGDDDISSASVDFIKSRHPLPKRARLDI
jgi:hypothetical protein